MDRQTDPWTTQRWEGHTQIHCPTPPAVPLSCTEIFPNFSFNYFNFALLQAQHGERERTSVRTPCVLALTAASHASPASRKPALCT